MISFHFHSRHKCNSGDIVHSSTGWVNVHFVYSVGRLGVTPPPGEMDRRGGAKALRGESSDETEGIRGDHTQQQQRRYGDDEIIPFESPEEELEEEEGLGHVELQKRARRREGLKRTLTFTGKHYLEFEVEATKTNGRLNLDICEDVAPTSGDEDDEEEGGEGEEREKKGLFVQNFLRPCAVEDEGLIFIGDELIAINKHPVDGFTIEELVEVLQTEDHPENPTVLLGIRRRRCQQTYQSFSFEDDQPHGLEPDSGDGSAGDIDLDDPQVLSSPSPLLVFLPHEIF